MLRIMLLGCPGAGKGTQAQFIAEQYHLVKISTGDMLREEIKQNSPLGKEGQIYMDTGQLVPDLLIIEMVKTRISRDDCIEGFLLDGFPRTIAQAEALISAEIFLNHVIELVVDEEEVVRRMSGRRVHLSSGRVYHTEFNPPVVSGKDDLTGEPLVQRVDDAEVTVRKRLAVYQEQTRPLVEFYVELAKKNDPRAPWYSQIDGMDSVVEVRNRIFYAIDEGRGIPRLHY